MVKGFFHEMYMPILEIERATSYKKYSWKHHQLWSQGALGKARAIETTCVLCPFIYCFNRPPEPAIPLLLKRWGNLSEHNRSPT